MHELYAAKYDARPHVPEPESRREARRIRRFAYALEIDVARECRPHRR